MRALGMMMALAAKQREGNLVVFDKLETEVCAGKAMGFKCSKSIVLLADAQDTRDRLFAA